LVDSLEPEGIASSVDGDDPPAAALELESLVAGCEASEGMEADGELESVESLEVDCAKAGSNAPIIAATATLIARRLAFIVGLLGGRCSRSMQRAYLASGCNS
jgi:hypothetical protein